MTVYVAKDASGNIVGVFAGPQSDPAFASVTETAEDDAAVVAYLTPATAPPTPREWLERLSATTQAAIFTAAAANATLLGWLFKASGNPAIDVTADETKTGVAALVTASVITQAEADTLLAA